MEASEILSLKELVVFGVIVIFAIPVGWFAAVVVNYLGQHSSLKRKLKELEIENGHLQASKGLVDIALAEALQEIDGLLELERQHHQEILDIIEEARNEND